MLQQWRTEILYHKFPEIFRGIIPEKYRYFSGKIPGKFHGNFRTHNPSQHSTVPAASEPSTTIYTEFLRILTNFKNIVKFANFNEF